MRTRATLVAILLPVFLCAPVATMAQAGAAEHGPMGQSPARAGPNLRELAALAPAAPITLATQPVTVTLAVPSAVRNQMVLSTGPAAKTTLLLTVNDIAFEKTPEAYFEVYLDLPAGGRPDYKSDHYVGNLSFFGMQNQTGKSKRGASTSFDITRTVRALQSHGLWKENEVTVTFVPTAAEDSEGRPLQVSPELRVDVATVKVLAAPTN